MKLTAYMALALLAAVVGALSPLPARAQGADVAAYKSAVEARFSQWLQELWPDAEAAGVTRETFDANIKGLKLDWKLPHLIFPDPAAPGGPGAAGLARRRQQAEAPAGIR